MTRIALATIAVAVTAASVSVSPALANVGAATHASVRSAVTDARDGASRLLLQMRSQNSASGFKKAVW